MSDRRYKRTVRCIRVIRSVLERSGKRPFCILLASVTIASEIVKAVFRAWGYSSIFLKTRRYSLVYWSCMFDPVIVSKPRSRLETLFLCKQASIRTGLRLIWIRYSATTKEFSMTYFDQPPESLFPVSFAPFDNPPRLQPTLDFPSFRSRFVILGKRMFVSNAGTVSCSSVDCVDQGVWFSILSLIYLNRRIPEGKGLARRGSTLS